MIRYDSAQFWKKNIPWDNQHSGTNCGSKNIEHRRQSMNIMNISGVTQKPKPWEASPIKAGWLLESGGHREMQIDCL